MYCELWPLYMWCCRERSIADQKKVGLSAGDEATQTEASHIVEIKQVADVIQTLLQV